MAPLTPYRWVAEGTGGIYTFPSDEISHIGTYDCQTCVGVYLAFEDETCFCAHINACIDIHPYGFEYIPDPHEGQELRNLIVSMLRAECGSAERLKKGREVIVVCPKIYRDKWASDASKWTKQMGWYIVEGIREWLAEDIADPKTFVCDEMAQGFVVDHRTGEVAKIPTTVSRAEVEGGVVVREWFAIPEDRSLSGREWAPWIQAGLNRRWKSI